MASITHYLLLSLLFLSIFLVKSDDDPDEEDNLLQGLNQYRISLRLRLLTHNDGIECLADDIADRYNNQPCPTTAPTQPKVSDYPDLITKCMLNNATLQGAQILVVCLPESQSAQLLSRYTTSPYNTYLNDSRYSGIGIGSDDNWSVIILTPATPATPTTPGTPATPVTPGTPDDDEDRLLQGLNQYRSSLRLSPLTHNEGVECLADDIADRYNNRPCPNTAPTPPKVSDYPDIIAKCRLNNATLQGAQILVVCLPESQSAQLLSRYTASPYNTYLNDTRYSGIGIGSDDNWSVIILTTATPGTPVTPGTPATPTTPGTPATPVTPGIPDDDEDRLLQGLNQYRSSVSLSPLTHNEGVECLADDIADRYNNRPCPNTAPTQPKVSDYPDIIAKCRLNNATLQGAQILPICLPESQSAQLVTRYTTGPYATYLNDTVYSGIGIGSDDNWTIIVLTTTTPGTPTTPGSPATPTTPGTPATGSSNSTNGATTPNIGGRSSNSDSGATGLTAISPVLVLVIGFFMLV